MTPAEGVILREAHLKDWFRLFEWRNHPLTHCYFRTAKPVTLEEHMRWFNQAMKLARRGAPPMRLFIIEMGSIAAGQIRLNRHARSRELFEVSITVAPGCRGMGVGTAALAALHRQRKDGISYTAEIHRENTTSLRLFANAGYYPFRTAGKWVGLAYPPPLVR